MRQRAVVAGVGGHVPLEGASPTTTDLAVPAAAAALRSAQVRTVDLLVLATARADHPAAHVAAWLGLDARALDITSGCAAFGYALAVVESLLVTGRTGRVLLVGVDTADTNPLSTDAAGALVLRAGKPCEPGAIHGLDSGELRAGRPPAERHATGRMLASARTALSRAGWTAADVEVLTTHEADAATLGADLGIARVIENPGPTSNTVAASIPLALAEITLDPGTRTLLSTFGGAGTWGAVALKWPRQNG